MAYRSINPFTEELVKEYPSHTTSEMQDALAAADAAFHSEWSQGAMATRLAVLTRMSELVVERAEEIATMFAVEMGKPIVQGRFEAQLCADICSYYAQNAERMLAAVPYPSAAGDAWVEHHPIGVLIAVEPWNYPFYQLVRVVAPAIAVGNPVLIKHAGIVPGSAGLFAELMLDAGAPVGACTNLYISGDQVAELLGDPRVQGVALTGSEKAGAAVASRASAMLKKSTLELGGSDVFAVLEDADIAKAAKVGAFARIMNAGQACAAAKRFIVLEAVAEEFTSALLTELKAFKLGDPMDETTTLGPLSSKEARDGLASQVDAAIAAGANMILGGEDVPATGFFFQPTVLTDISRDNPAYHEEFFGPVAQLYVVKDDEEMLALANDSQFGLGGAIWSADIDRAKSLASRIESGMVIINGATGTSAELPFGGVKRSGFGRELGDLGIMEFVNKKLVVIAA